MSGMPKSDETIPVRPGEQLDWLRVEHYLREHLAGIDAAPMEVRQFPSGASNLTYLVQGGAWKAVLRCPPLGPLPPQAHDMKRESSLLTRIHPVFDLPPRPYF